MITLTLPPELENAIMERAQHEGTTPELFLLDDLLKRFLPDNPPEPPAVAEPQEGKSMADFFVGYAGTVNSREIVPEGAQLSRETGRKFKELLVEKRRQGKL